jgi:hypothetical protein
VTDEHPESPEIEAVRRLLSDARHTGPMPDDVAARLDRALADLAHAPEHQTSADVVPLDVEGRRRRRRAAGLLVAAAAVVVGGVVVAPHLARHSANRSSASETAGGATSEGARPPRTAEPRASTPDTRVVVVHPRHLAAAALAARRQLKAPSPQYSSMPGAAVLPCVAAPPHGQVLRATYGRAPAALVYQPPSAGSQKVTLVVCGPPSRPIRSVTIPAP